MIGKFSEASVLVSLAGIWAQSAAAIYFLFTVIEP